MMIVPVSVGAKDSLSGVYTRLIDWRAVTQLVEFVRGRND